MRLRMDWLLFGTILVMVSFGLVMVYSASSVTQEIKRKTQRGRVKAHRVHIKSCAHLTG